MTRAKSDPLYVSADERLKRDTERYARLDEMLRPLVEQIREYGRLEGRREVLREIAKLPYDRSGQYEGSCYFCGSDEIQPFGDGPIIHSPDCIWLKAQFMKDAE